MTEQDKARARLRAYVAHFIDHAQDHVVEIETLRPAVAGDGPLAEALEHALQDVRQARRSLSALLDELEATAVSGAKPHDHDLPHIHHSHAHVHGGTDVT